MLGRELTKQFEEILVGSAAELIDAVSEQPRGEFTGIVAAAQGAAAPPDQQRVLAALLEELKPAQAARIAANICGTSKSVMYDLAMQMASSD